MSVDRVECVVRLDRVSRRYRSAAETVVAVDAVTLELRAGEIVGLAGPSGSGKTTTLNLILGWEDPDDGTVAVTAPGEGWRSTAVVPQELGLLPELTARENVLLSGRLVGGAVPSVSDLDELFAALGLDALAHRHPDELSMGEQQRVAVARAVAMAPALLVADEPTAHQDELRADQIMEQLAGVASGGGAVLVATHDERLLDRVDRVIRMLDGRVEPD